VLDAEMAQTIAFVIGHWPAWRPNDATIDATRRLLVDLPYNQVCAAVDQIAVEGAEFAPTGGMIRAKVVELFDPDLPPCAGEAWADVLYAIRTFGRNRRPSFTHSIVGAAVDALGGWAMLCASDNPVADRAHFLRIYEPLADRYRKRALYPPSVREALAEAALADARSLTDLLALTPGEPGT